jgi:predicted  nucleic acid-binding Zn-ribbon protein
MEEDLEVVIEPDVVPRGTVDLRRLETPDRRRREPEPNLQAQLAQKEAEFNALRAALNRVQPSLDRLEHENRRLSRLLGEARERGRVEIEDLIVREQVLRVLEALSED